MDLKDRVIKIVTTPKTEWPVIAAETTDVASLYKGYIIPLAAIPVIATFIGMTVFGVNAIIVRYRVPIGTALTNAILTYVLMLAGVYLSALVIDWLAPKFQSVSGLIQALKLVAYASTPMWIAGVLNIVPALAIFGALIGLYGIYLFYLGMTPTMKTPQNQIIPYMVVSLIVVIVVQIIVGAIVAAIASPLVRTPIL